MGGERARLTITSPPYNIGTSRFPSSRHGASKYLHNADALPASEYLRLLVSATENALAVSDIVVVNLQLLAANKVTILEYLHHFRSRFIDVAVWDKLTAQPVMARNVLNSRYELLLFFTNRTSKGRTPRTIFTADFRGTVANVYQGPAQRHNPYFRLHAATFPLHLPRWLMQTFDADTSLVFDPFLGTGTTLLAAEETGRRCVGMEINPVYADIILHRYEMATGRPPQKIG
jgi:DNA modification methylase